MEQEVASYVLAYLLKGNYSITAAAFLQECTALPRTLMVLPQTPLPEIIATYKAWTDANVLKNALGPAATLNALWSKLDQTLIQIKKLSDDVMLMEQPKIVHKGTVQLHNHPMPTTAQSTDTDIQGHPCGSKVLAGAKSPRRKRPHPQRNMRATVGTTITSTNDHPHQESEISHIMDSFLSDTSLTERLADIINRCVERPSGEVELSSSTLDHILDITCTEPAFEGVLKGMETPPVVASKEDAVFEPPTKHHRGDPGGSVFPCSMDLDSFLDEVHAGQ